LREHTFVNSNQKGNVAELAIAAEAARLGLAVLKPLSEHGRYDLVFAVGMHMLRVQRKWGTLTGDVVFARVGSCYHSPTRGYVKTTYEASEVDLIAIYCEELTCCYLLPVELVTGQSRIQLRLKPAKNNQRAALNLAAHYEFRGAIAQLEERLTGSQEVAGSSPASSTLELESAIRASFSSHDRLEDLKKEVGMDEFYAKLAHYVRQAEAGGEFLVTRWGHPVARLGPAAQSQTLALPCR
jgi:prevent-host-death family protein